MDREKIICIFCGAIAKIKEQYGMKYVTCSQCERETEMDKYQDLFDKWLGDIRTMDGER